MLLYCPRRSRCHVCRKSRPRWTHCVTVGVQNLEVGHEQSSAGHSAQETGLRAREWTRMISMLILLRCDGFSESTLLLKPGTDRGSGDRLVEKAGPAPVAAKRRIGNRFPPPPLFLHEPGRFEGTQVDTSRLDGCRQTLDVERVRPQTTCRQSVTETRSNGFDSLRCHHCHCMRSVSRCASIVQGRVRFSAGRRAGPHASGSTGTSCAAVRLSCASVRRPRVRVAGRRAIVVR